MVGYRKERGGMFYSRDSLTEIKCLYTCSIIRILRGSLLECTELGYWDSWL